MTAFLHLFLSAGKKRQRTGISASSPAETNVFNGSPEAFLENDKHIGLKREYLREKVTSAILEQVLFLLSKCVLFLVLHCKLRGTYGTIRQRNK